MNGQISRRAFLGVSGTAVGRLATDGRGQSGKPLRVGFVGVGNRGSALLKAALQVQGVEVAGVCDIDSAARARAADAAQTAQGRRPDEFDLWSKLLARDDIPVVVSALPCWLHFKNYDETLAAGKHLYGEKPLCLSVADADTLVQRAGASGRVFQIGFQRRFGKPLQEAVRMVRDGAIGPPFDGRGGRFAAEPIRRPGEWFSFREKSGDWMLEQAVHNWDALNWALGELPISAVGFGRQDLWRERDPARDVSDYYTAILHYRSGLNYTWNHSWLTTADPLFSSTYEQLTGPSGSVDLAKGYAAFRRGGRNPVRLEKEARDSTLAALQSFFDCARSGERPVVGVQEGKAATLVGLLVRTAVYEQRLVSMEEVTSLHRVPLRS